MATAREEQIKHWMRVGMQDDKWIHPFLPDAPLWHPWFDSDKNPKPENIAHDTMDAYHAPEEAASLVTKWAQEVVEEYTKQKEAQKHG